MRAAFVTAAAVAASAFESPGYGGADSLTTATRFTEEEVATIPSGYRATLWVTSDDHRSFAIVCAREGETRVARDTVLGRAYDTISSVGFTSDGAHLIYCASRGGAQFAVVDSTEGEAYGNVAGYVVSAKGGRYAFLVKQGDRWLVIADGRSSPPFDQVQDLNFSDDGNHLGYAARDGDKWSIIVDDRVRHRIGKWLRGPIFSADGEHVALAEQSGDRMVWSRDTTTLAECKGCETVRWTVFDSDLQHTAYAVQQKERWAVSVDGARRQEWDDVKGAVFSGGHLYYAGYLKRGRAKWSLVRDSTAMRSFSCEDLVGPFLSQDGRRVACALRVEEPFGMQWMVDVDGVAGPMCEKVWRPKFSSDGAHYAYSAVRGATYGKRPLFAPRGWSPYVDYGTARQVVVVDGTELLGYDEVLAGSEYFPAPDRLRFLILRDRRVLQVEYAL